MKNKQIFRKIISYILVCGLILCSFPVGTFAETTVGSNNGEAVGDIERVNADMVESADKGTEDETNDSAIESEPQTDNNNIELHDASFEFSTLSGQVVDKNGIGLAGVSVSIYNYDEHEMLTTVKTTSDGKWHTIEYDAIVGYKYIVNYYKSGYSFSANNIEVTAESGGTTVHKVTATELELNNLVCNPEDYSYTVSDEKATIKKYNGDDSEILLPETLGGYPVVAIGDSAFRYNRDIAVICFSDNITAIGERAFSDCTNLSDIHFSNVFENIESNAFEGCSGLTEV